MKLKEALDIVDAYDKPVMLGSEVREAWNTLTQSQRNRAVIKIAELIERGIEITANTYKNIIGDMTGKWFRNPGGWEPVHRVGKGHRSLIIIGYGDNGEQFIVNHWYNVDNRTVREDILPYWEELKGIAEVPYRLYEMKGNRRVITDEVTPVRGNPPFKQFAYKTSDGKFAITAEDFGGKSKPVYHIYGWIGNQYARLTQEPFSTYERARKELDGEMDYYRELLGVRTRRNPGGSRGSAGTGVRPAVRIGRQVTAVEYLDEEKARAENLRNPGTPWRHDYKNNSGAEVLGVDNGAVVIAPKGTKVLNLPDGTAIIKGKAKRKLWGYR